MKERRDTYGIRTKIGNYDDWSIRSRHRRCETWLARLVMISTSNQALADDHDRT